MGSPTVCRARLSRTIPFLSLKSVHLHDGPCTAKVLRGFVGSHISLYALIVGRFVSSFSYVLFEGAIRIFSGRSYIKMLFISPGE